MRLYTAYFEKVDPLTYKIVGAKNAEETKERAKAFTDAVEREVEPLLREYLVGPGPFCGGSEGLTMAEVCFVSNNDAFLASDCACCAEESEYL